MATTKQRDPRWGRLPLALVRLKNLSPGAKMFYAVLMAVEGHRDVLDADIELADIAERTMMDRKNLRGWLHQLAARGVLEIEQKANGRWHVSNRAWWGALPQQSGASSPESGVSRPSYTENQSNTDPYQGLIEEHAPNVVALQDRRSAYG